MPRAKEGSSDISAKHNQSNDPRSTQVSVLNLNPISRDTIVNQDHIALISNTTGQLKGNTEQDAIGETASCNNQMDSFSKASTYSNFKSQKVN